MKIPVEIMKINKEVFLKCGIFFLNKIPFFLTLIQNIYLTAVNHLQNRMVPDIFKAFKEVHQYYPHRVFHITPVYTDGEFKPLKNMIEFLLGGTIVNMVAANDNVSDIEQRISVMKEWCRSTRRGFTFQ